MLISCNVLPGISDHDGVLLEVEWSDKCRDDNAGRIVPMYHKTNVLGMQTFLREKYKQWVGIGSCVEEIQTNYKEIIFKSIECYVPHKTLPKNPDPEYYNKEVKRLKVKVRKTYITKKAGLLNQAELNHLSKELLTAKKKAQETYLHKILQNKGTCWAEFFKVCKET